MNPKAERERPLSAEGRATAKAIAKAMLDAGEVPSVIFCSPFARTTQTADIYGLAFSQSTGDRVSVNSVGDFAPDRPLELGIAGLIGSDKLRRVMIVGHVDNTTPAFNTFADDDGAWPDLVMAEVRRIEIDRKSCKWDLRWALRPSDLGLKDYK